MDLTHTNPKKGIYVHYRSFPRIAVNCETSYQWYFLSNTDVRQDPLKFRKKVNRICPVRYTPIFQDSVPTQVQGKEMYIGGSGDSARVNTVTMTQTAYFADAVLGEGHSSYVPFGNNLMVKTNQGAPYQANAFTYFSIGTNAEATGQTQIVVGQPQLNVMVFNNSGVDIAIAVGDTGNGWMVGSTAWAPIPIDRAIYNAFVSGNELVLLCDAAQGDVGAIYRLNAVSLIFPIFFWHVLCIRTPNDRYFLKATGQLITTHNFTTYQGASYSLSNIAFVMYQNGKSLASVTFGESSVSYSMPL